MAQLIKPQIKWTEEKINLLKLQYPLGDKQVLANTLNISRKTLKNAAQRFGIHSLQDKNFYKLKPLYEDSMLSYYWMGFIMADGQIDNRGQLIVSLSEKDEIHLQKLANFLNIRTHHFLMQTKFSNKKLPYIRLSCQDAKYGKLILKKFGLNGKPKTYYPPNKLHFLNNNYFLAFFLGFIDGDGCIVKDYKQTASYIRIEGHKSWFKIYTLFKKLLKVKNCTLKINKRGFADFRLYKKKNLFFLKTFGINNQLPLLERKWQFVTTEHDFRFGKHEPKLIL